VRRYGTEFRHWTALDPDFQEKPDRRQGMVDLLSGLSPRRRSAPGRKQPQSVFQRFEVENDAVCIGFSAGGRHGTSLATLIGRAAGKD